jgi:exopolysaccharide production protein ExoZ
VAPSRDGKLTAIEAFRGIAATIVVLYHVARHLNFAYGLPGLMRIFQFGHSGVDLFFVISGFIILYVHYDDIGRPTRVIRYAKRRFTRVMPTYWVALLLTVSLTVIGGHHPLPSVISLLWSTVLLPSHHEPILGVAWTLQYEIFFYIIFCTLVLNRTVGAVIFFGWFILIVVAAGEYLPGDYLPGSIYGVYNIEFLLGIAIAYWMRNRVVPAPWAMLFSGAFLLVIVSGAEDLGWFNGYANVGRFLYGPSAVLLVLAGAELSRQRAINVPKAILSLGTASYSIYLFQFVFIGIAWQLWRLSRLDGITPHWASFPLLVGAGVFGGVAASRFIEYPLMRVVRGQYRKAAPHAVSL